jgi:anti-sigma factor RsiW
MSKGNTSDLGEQLSAYLDGELDAAASHQVEDALTRDPAAADMLKVLEDTRTLVQDLPLEAAPSGFLEEVMAEAERDALVGPAAAVTMPARRSRGPIAAAASIVLMATVAGGYIFTRSDDRVAHLETPELAVPAVNTAERLNVVASADKTSAVPQPVEADEKLGDRVVANAPAKRLAPPTVAAEESAERVAMASSLETANARTAEKPLILGTPLSVTDQLQDARTPEGIVELTLQFQTDDGLSAFVDNAVHFFEHNNANYWDASQLALGVNRFRHVTSGGPAVRQLVVEVDPEDLAGLIQRIPPDSPGDQSAIVDLRVGRNTVRGRAQAQETARRIEDPAWLNQVYASVTHDDASPPRVESRLADRPLQLRDKTTDVRKKVKTKSAAGKTQNETESADPVRAEPRQARKRRSTREAPATAVPQFWKEVSKDDEDGKDEDNDALGRFDLIGPPYEIEPPAPEPERIMVIVNLLTVPKATKAPKGTKRAELPAVAKPVPPKATQR